jgi:hypothetical protein
MINSSTVYMYVCLYAYIHLIFDLEQIPTS